jgi:XTP/dITP diphosphohydrolase
MTIHLVLATGNSGKVREMEHLLRGWKLSLKPSNIEIEETGRTYLANARLKAMGVAKATGKWSIGEDSGIEVLALNGRPGIYSARSGCSDEERNNNLLMEMEGIEDRRARFVSCVVLASPEKILCEYEESCEGEVLTSPKGDEGFGYDPIFYYPPMGLTTAEMPLEQKQKISHRGKALQKLLLSLEQLVQREVMA